MAIFPGIILIFEFGEIWFGFGFGLISGPSDYSESSS